ncbi:MAG: hypothetical protein AMJ45_05125, partial [Syntrophobacter sp. DG_60]
ITYYYSAFSYDHAGNYSQTAYASTTPFALAEPDIALSETSHDYGEVEIGSFSDWALSIQNQGDKTLSIKDIFSDNEDFIVISPCSFPQEVAPGQSIEVTIRFAPSAPEQIGGELTIISNDPDEATVIVSLTGTGQEIAPPDDPDPEVTGLQNGQEITGLSGSEGSESHFFIEVPSGTEHLEVKIWGGSGDCDLYVRYGSQATINNWDYRPWLNGNSEKVDISDPESGKWYIMLEGHASYSDVSLKVKHTERNNPTRTQKTKGRRSRN